MAGRMRVSGKVALTRPAADSSRGPIGIPRIRRRVGGGLPATAGFAIADPDGADSRPVRMNAAFRMSASSSGGACCNWPMAPHPNLPTGGRTSTPTHHQKDRNPMNGIEPNMHLRRGPRAARTGFGRRRPAGRRTRIRQPIAAAAVGVLIAGANPVLADQGEPLVVQPRAGGEIEVAGLPSEGLGTGPVSFRIPGGSGYAGQIAVSGQPTGALRIGAGQLFLEFDDPAWSGIDGLRAHAVRAGIEIDRAGGNLIGAAITGMAVGAREGSALEDAVGRVGRNRSLLSVGEIGIRLSGGPEDGTGPLPDPQSGTRSAAAARPGLRIVANDVRLSGLITGLAADVGGGNGQVAKVSADTELEAAFDGDSLNIEAAALVRLDGVPELRISAVFDAGGSGTGRWIKGRLAVAEAEAGIGFAGHPAGAGGPPDAGSDPAPSDELSGGRRFAEGLAGRLGNAGPDGGPFGELAGLLAEFARKGGTVVTSIEWNE